MRQLTRLPLPTRVQNYLKRKQREIDAGHPIQETWQAARRTRSMARLAQVLASMSGTRQRCMFCSDSRSTDVDHFWPKLRYRSRVFRWNNLLWICAGCNRQKGDRFPLDRHRQPLLIDPTAEDPWDFLYFDGHTGNITARYDPSSGLPCPKGHCTADPAILPLYIEAVTEGRLRTRRNLVRAVRSFLLSATHNAQLDKLETELLETIRDNDDYGLARWYFGRDGRSEEPFRAFQALFGPVCARILRGIQTNFT